MDVNFGYTNGDGPAVVDHSETTQMDEETPMNKAVISHFTNYSNALACQGAAIPPPMVNFSVPRLAYRFKALPPPVLPETDALGRRMRHGGSSSRRQVDITSSILNYVERRMWDSTIRERGYLTQSHVLYAGETYPMICTKDKSIECVMTRSIRSAVNKIKCPIFDLCWTPEGRRLITGGSSGEFTLWNGTAFNFETILQAHDSAVRSMEWSHNQEWMVTADHDGFVKYWQGNMNNVVMFQAHRDAVRSLSFSPTDAKFATASDDATVRIWDFKCLGEERILRGHGSDVRAVDWHPTKGLIVTGSRDSQQPVKLWDPRSDDCLRTLHFHKSGVTTVSFNANGNWLLTGSRDHLVKLIDIRTMNEIFTYKGHYKDVTAVAWHPIHETIFVSGGGDGALIYWDTLSDRELTLVEGAHEQAIWALSWHPLGHILASGSNDNNTKFWTRNKPGDLVEDFYAAPQFSFDHAARTTGANGSPERNDEEMSPSRDDLDEHSSTNAINMSDSFDEELFYKVPGLSGKGRTAPLDNHETPVCEQQPPMVGSGGDQPCVPAAGQLRFPVPPPPIGHPLWIRPDGAMPWRPTMMPPPPVWCPPDGKDSSPRGVFFRPSFHPSLPPRMVGGDGLGAASRMQFVPDAKMDTRYVDTSSSTGSPHSTGGKEEMGNFAAAAAARLSRWGPPLPYGSSPHRPPFLPAMDGTNHLSEHIRLPPTAPPPMGRQEPNIDQDQLSQMNAVAMLRAMGQQKMFLPRFPPDPTRMTKST